jgi:hypothetical protein
MPQDPTAEPKQLGPYWHVLHNFLRQQYGAELEALHRYAAGEPAELSLAVASHKVFGDHRGDADVIRAVWEDLQARVAVIERHQAAEYAPDDSPLKAELPGLRYAVQALARPYSAAAGYPGEIA